MLIFSVLIQTKYPRKESIFIYFVQMKKCPKKYTFWDIFHLEFRLLPSVFGNTESNKEEQ